MSDLIPGSVGLYGIIPFAVVLVLSFLGCAWFMRYFWKSNERDIISAVTATFGLWFALLTSFLLPFDVFLISFMKNSDGTFKDWATNATRTSVEDGLSYAYYTLYAIILLFVFFLLPLVYFTYEEKNELEESFSRRCCSGLWFALVFVVAAGILLIVGAFIPYRNVPRTANSTEWDTISMIFNRMYSNRGIDGLYFTLNILMFIGMIMLLIYTGSGVASFPVSCIRGWRNLTQEKEVLEERKLSLATKKARLEAHPKRSQKYQKALSEIEEEENLLEKMESQIETSLHTIWYRMSSVIKVFYIVVGLLGCILGFMIWLSLLLSNIDKFLHSMGYHDSYILAVEQIMNPLDYIMVQCQKIFPIDYIFFFGIILFLVCCTIGGIRDIGIWCFFVRMYRIRPHMTQPQALIILCAIMMYTVLGLNVLIYSIMPQYTTFGSQHYSNGTHTGLHCTQTAPEGECLLTKMSSFLVLFAIKAWIFGTAYYWMTWVFLIMVLVGFLWAVFRKKLSYINEAVDKDDFDDSDDDVRPLVA